MAVKTRSAFREHCDVEGTSAPSKDWALQVYDMSVMRAAQRQPCRKLLRDALRPKAMSTHLRGICEERCMRSRWHSTEPYDIL